MDTGTATGPWVRQRRLALDLTQEALAQQVGCSTEMIGKIETDTRRPSRQVAALLAVALELPPDAQPRFVQWARRSPELGAPAGASAADPHNGGRQSTLLSPVPPGLGPADSQDPAGANPYKGLRAFDEADALDFFGREALAHRLAERLAEEEAAAHFLAVVGPSGSGKSSVVQAGLLPLLRRQPRPGGRGAPWTPLVVELTPSTHPFEELEAGLLRVAVNPPASLMAQLRDDERGLARAVKRALPADAQTELVLVIDQFEELFTLTRDEAARADFLDSLFAAVVDPGSRLWVVATLRADFYDRPLLYASSGALLARRTEVVVPLTPGELYRAITGPAERAGLALEADLAATIMQDVGEQPGTLPLLQYALTELYERRAGRLLTLAAYRASGGVLGSLARRAESVYAGLTGGEQEEARQLFLRLVTLGDGTEDTRRRVRRAELVSAARDEAALQRVLDEFGRYRMLTFDRDALAREPTVEVAHEALLRTWPRLREWLDASRAALHVQRRLLRATTEWRAADMDPSHLAGGTRLGQFADLAASDDLALTEDERAYLAASQAEGERQLAADRTRQAHELALARQSAAAQRSAAQRLRGLVGALALFLVVATGLAIFAFSQQAAADSARATAVANVTHSQALLLAARANAALQSNQSTDLIGLLAVRSLDTEYTAEGDAILQAAADLDYPRRLFVGGGGGGVFSADGKYLLDCQPLAFDNLALLFDVASGRSVMTYKADSLVTAVALAPDSAIVAASLRSGAVVLWDRASGRQLRSLTAGNSVPQGLTFSPDSKMLLTGGSDSMARLWDTATARAVLTFTGHAAAVNGVAFSPDGTFVLTGSTDKTARLWDAATARPVLTFTGHTEAVNSVAFAPDGTFVLTGGDDNTMRLWNAATGHLLRVFSGHTDRITSVTFSPDGTLVLSGSNDATMLLWDIASGRQLRRFAPMKNFIHGVAFTPDGQAVLEDDNEGVARLWDLHPPRPFPPFAGHPGNIWSAAFSPDGTRLLTGGARGSDGTARLWDVRTGAELQRFAGHGGNLNSVAFAPDGNTIMTATGNPENTIRFWDARSGALLRAFSPRLPPAQPPGHAALAPDGKTVLAGTREGPELLIDALSGQILRTLEGHVNRTVWEVYAPDGKTAFSGGDDPTVIQWDLASGRELRRFTDAGGVVLSYDGKILLTGGLDNSARLWDAQTGALLATYPGLGGPRDISRDGTLVLSGTGEGSNLWETATGHVLRHISTSVGGLNAAAIAPDGKTLLVSNEAGALALWYADYHDTLRSLCSRLPRDLSPAERTAYGITDASPTCPPP